MRPDPTTRRPFVTRHVYRTLCQALACLLILPIACTSNATPEPAAVGKAPAEKTSDAAGEAAGEGFRDELNRRFLLALERVQSAPAASWREGGLTGLYYLEKDFGVRANAAEITAKVLASGTLLPSLVREKPGGIAEIRPLESGIDWAWIRERMQPGLPARPSDQALAMLFSLSAVGHCLPAEADYNARFLRRMDTLAWPADTEWVQYGLYAGFLMHGCIGERVFREQSAPLVPRLVRWLGKRDRPVDQTAYVLFALAASERLSAVPTKIIIDFIRAQRPDGSWGGSPIEQQAENQAPLGAYVIATLLQAGGYPLPQTDFRLTSPLTQASVLPPAAAGEVLP